MNYLERDLHVPSVGWVYLEKSVKRSSAEYGVRAEEYTATHQRLHEVRSTILSLADEANMRPPLIRPDIRTGRRNDEIIATLGTAGISLLAQHELAYRANLMALFDLRSENQRLGGQVHSQNPTLVSPVENRYNEGRGVI